MRFSVLFRSFVSGAAISLLGLATHTASAQGVSYTAAGRLLNQASFGPTINDIWNVQGMGLSNYIQYQISIPAYQMQMPLTAADYQSGDCFGWVCAPEYWWWSDVLWGQDQLRQRVAYALSKLFVVSYQEVDPRYFPYYLNTLSRDAFGNWLTLMTDVSLSPAMGMYLNAANSLYSPTSGHADENFSRELMQLFSIGTVKLNNDGSPQLDGNGNTIPNYTPAQVQDLGRAFTGWTLANNLDGSTSCSTPSQPNYYGWAWPWGMSCPMVPMSQYHDPGQKTILRGQVLSAGQSPQQDWNAALSNIFNDPSLPPFVSTRLIQNLVKSNPSRAYVNRISNVFINDGKGVRGNLAAVIPAILMDPEARADDNGGVSDPNTGLLRDPMLEYTSFLRASQSVDTLPWPYINIFAGRFSQILNDLLENPHASPSVFSFYSPTNSITVPGTNNKLLAPEFQLENSMTLSLMILHMQDVINGNFNMGDNNLTPEMVVDLSPTSAVGKIGAQQGVDEMLWVLNLVLMHGTMTPEMTAAVKSGIANDLDMTDMIRDAIFLIITSPQYRVMV